MRIQRASVAAWWLGTVVLISAPSHAQPKAEPKAPAKDDAQWNELSETDDPEVVEEDLPEQPKPGAVSPYRASEAEQAVAEVKPGDGDVGDDYSESVAWMKPWTPRSQIRHISIEYDVLSTSADTAMSWDLVIQAVFGEGDGYGGIFFDLPWTYLFSAETASIANPTFGGHGGGKVHDQVALYGGLLVSIPTLTADSSPERAAAAFAGGPMRALIDTQRFVAFNVPIRLRLGAEFQLHPLVYLRTEIDPTLMIPTEGQDVEFVMDHVTDFEVLSPIGLGGGLRFQEAFAFTSAADSALGAALQALAFVLPDDAVQTALEPFIVYEPPFAGPFELPLRARIGLLIALDDALGFGFDTNKVMTLRTSVGVRF